MKSKVTRRKSEVKRRRAFTIRRRSQRSTLNSQPSRGFTLVEMLVSVALVLLMMTLFAQIFQIAGGSVSTQRGIMENDQRARTAQILIAGDLNKRTFRYVLPFALNEDITSNAPEANLADRRGYFYYSENSLADDTDDVLAFTVDASITLDNKDELPYFGRALGLWPHPAIPTGVTPPQVPATVPLAYRDDYFFRNSPNQPETDDARLDYNQAASSQYAEVVYFLRNGNLYRRVLLIRQPADGSVTESDQQPRDVADERFFGFSYSNSAGRFPTNFSRGYDSTGVSIGAATNFWQHFDYSAHPATAYDTSTSQYYYDGLLFNGQSSLQLQTIDTFPLTTATTSFVAPTALAYPPNRFGFNTINARPLNTTPAPPFGGQPREYGTGGWWVGRPTMEESSHAAMQYPMLAYPTPTTLTDSANDFNTATVWNDTTPVDGVIDGYAGGPWRGEDLLLTNVHSFDIKIWDDALSRFVDVGHSLAGGDYNLTKQKNPYFGPNFGSNRVFDTWYPFYTEDLNNDGAASVEEPSAGFQPFNPTFDFDNDGARDATEDRDGDMAITVQALNFDPVNGTQPIVWVDNNSDTVVDAGENAPPFRPSLVTPVLGASGSAAAYERWVQWTGTQRYSVGSRVFPPAVPQAVQNGDPFYYICVGIQENSPADGIYEQGMTPPTDWPRTPGLTFKDNELIWQAVDNRKPLRAIQITLRFVDPTTGQMRTLTLQHSLVD